MLRVDRIDSYYGEYQALCDVSFHVKEKEIATIVGNNGAGKTTILKSLSGLVKPRRGSIVFKGMNIEHLPSHRVVERGLSLVPEGRGVFPRMTVMENLEMGSHIPSARKNRKANIEKVFAYFPVLDKRKMQLAGTLSGGNSKCWLLPGA